MRQWRYARWESRSKGAGGRHSPTHEEPNRDGDVDLSTWSSSSWSWSLWSSCPDGGIDWAGRRCVRQSAAFGRYTIAATRGGGGCQVPHENTLNRQQTVAFGHIELHSSLEHIARYAMCAMTWQTCIVARHPQRCFGTHRMSRALPSSSQRYALTKRATFVRRDHCLGGHHVVLVTQF